MITAIKKTKNQASTEITKKIKKAAFTLCPTVTKITEAGPFYFTPISRDYEYNSIKTYKDENGNSYKATITAPCWH